MVRMMRIVAALALVLLAIFLASGYDLEQLDLSGRADALLDKTADAIWNNEDVQAAYRQAHTAADINAANKAVQDIKGLMEDAATTILERTSSYIYLAEKYWQTFSWKAFSWQMIAGLVFIISLLYLFIARLTSLLTGEDWSKCSSEGEVDMKCIEPLLKGWKFNYVPQRPCKIREGHETREGQIDFYLCDKEGPLTIFEDKATIKSDDDLKNARAQARSYCIGLYIFEDIMVNSFVIASKEGLWIYRIRNNEDVLVQRANPRALNWSAKRKIKNLLLELR